MVNEVKDQISTGANNLRNAAGQAVDAVKEGASNAADAVRDRATKLRGDAGDAAHEASERAQYAALYADDAIERGTEALPTNGLVAAALGSIGVSLVLKLVGRDRDAEFVGHWAPTFLGLAVLSKLTTHMKRDRR